MSNLMDKISNKLGANEKSGGAHGEDPSMGPSSNTRSSQRRGNMDDTYSTQDQGLSGSGNQGGYMDDSAQGYPQQHQRGATQGMGRSGGLQDEYATTGHQGGTRQGGASQMYDQDDQDLYSSKKQGGLRQQGYGTQQQTGFDDRQQYAGTQDAQFGSTGQDQLQFQRRF